jgi:hypothetical protein
MHAGRITLSRHFLLAATRLDQERFHCETWQVREIVNRLDPTGGRHRTDATESQDSRPDFSPQQVTPAAP